MDRSKYFHLYQTKEAHDLDYTRLSVNYHEPWVAYSVNTEDVTYNLPYHDFSTDYLTFTAIESGTFTLTIPTQITTDYITSVSYSVDNGDTWATTENTSSEVIITTPTITAGGNVIWKGTGTATGVNSSGLKRASFSSTGTFNASGNPLSLLYGDNFANVTSFGSGTRHLAGLFMGCTTLVNASLLCLTITTLTGYCYLDMFQGCTSLTAAPSLPATALADSCYWAMFDGCTSLTTAPELPSTTLAANCYVRMFAYCSSLTTAPVLPSTSLKTACYQQMFVGCTSLETAPEIPATTLAQHCCDKMFMNCTSLTTAPSILPATTLQKYCYQNMFYGCTALTTAPVLPATTLVSYCYDGMLRECTKLNYIKAMFTTTPSTSYTQYWVWQVPATGTFVKNSAAEWDVTGAHGIPSGWTVETASE